MIRKILITMLVVAAVNVGIYTYFTSAMHLSGKTWKYSHGAYISDIVKFGDAYLHLDGRKVMKGNEHIADVRFCLGGRLILRPVKEGKDGYYVHK